MFSMMKAFNVEWRSLENNLDVDIEIFNVKLVFHLSYLRNDIVVNWLSLVFTLLEQALTNPLIKLIISTWDLQSFSIGML